jgi:hypothetical protein
MIGSVSRDRSARLWIPKGNSYELDKVSSFFAFPLIFYFSPSLTQKLKKKTQASDTDILWTRSLRGERGIHAAK